MDRTGNTLDRRDTRPVRIGSVTVGGGAPVAVQSMLSLPSYDIEGSVAQARRLQAAGCELVRAAVPDREAVRLIAALKEALDIPVIADIHFDYRLAIESVAAGADKIRINPGNIGEESRVKAVVEACKARNVPIRVGVNSGSLEKEILKKYGAPTPEALVESALYHAALIERYDYDNLVLALKSSDVARTIASYRLARERCRYPFHLGVTEAGTLRMGMLKSAIGIGSLLCDGIGDTIRVSLTADPVEEVAAARDILRICGLRGGINVVSCPTCGRTRVGLIPLAEKVERALSGIQKDITVAVMGCAVNGPGEAREADIGVACGDGCGLLFQKGEILRKVPEEEILPALLELVEKQ
ncbi:MAG: flavodoxin-dependent (E)-4-hydroxy-3-methylbut-2-enyl-diphosphate synthase [Provencibacterium sp.]|jgi:(E)-4-hydroxy-3-methylbut-2-enyl-diphosphate synthase|nr:flavodoxin-dependent (E)-4-hydroxy-3-methylbut-2-enyl-diphosphate synthase [Provencibacterium sp.]